MMRERPAPRAVRIANSSCRAMPRLVRMFARLTHTSNSRQPTAPSSRYNDCRRSAPTTAAPKGAASTPQPLFVSGYTSPSRSLTTESCARACSIETPGLSSPSAPPVKLRIQ
jgi:hypothetical protein